MVDICRQLLDLTSCQLSTPPQKLQLSLHRLNVNVQPLPILFMASYLLEHPEAAVCSLGVPCRQLFKLLRCDPAVLPYLELPSLPLFLLLPLLNVTVHLLSRNKLA